MTLFNYSFSSDMSSPNVTAQRFWVVCQNVGSLLAMLVMCVSLRCDVQALLHWTHIRGPHWRKSL